LPLILQFLIVPTLILAFVGTSFAQLQLIPGVRFNVPRSPEFVALGDLDDDGVADIVIASPASKTVTALTASPTAELAPLIGFSLGRTLSGIAVADFDQDGRDDILLTDAAGGARKGDLLYLRRTGRLSFAPVQSFGLPVFSLRSLAIGDFDGNGYTDAVIATGTRDEIAAMLNGDGAPSFLAAPLIALKNNPRRIRSVPIDFSGRDALIVLNTNTNRTEELVIFQHDGTSFIEPGTIYPLAATAPVDFVTGDFDGDGLVDIAVLHAQSDRIFYITTLLNRTVGSEDGGSASANFTSLAPLLFDCPTDSSGNVTRCLPQAIAAGDFNRDGITDLAVAITRPAELLFLNGFGDGDFDYSGRLLVSGAVTMSVLVTGDVTGNGADDLVIADTGNNSIIVLRANVPPGRPLGTGCRLDADCTSSACVNDICCSTSTCANGWRCDIEGEEGRCAPTAGTGSSCSRDQSCATGACTDGVCCNEAACALGERCDIFGTRGDCRARLGTGAACLNDSDCLNDGPCAADDESGGLACQQIPPTPGPTICYGDCSGDGNVTVNEVLVLIEIALGAQDITNCTDGDIDADGQISVDELLTAVGFALVGCP